MTPEQLLRANNIALPDTTAGRHYTTCPQCSAKRSKAHQKSKCLSVTIEASGRVGWCCFNCSWTGPEKRSGDTPLTSYIYRDRDGGVRFRKVRNKPGREPRFFLQQPDGKGGWKKGVANVDTGILYRIDEVSKAIAADRVVCIVEGEKDCDHLWRLDIPATCSAHGASKPDKKPKWYRGYSAQLSGADIVVFNDNDDAGYQHADETCRLSCGVAKRVRRLDLKLAWPDIKKGGDVSDWLAAGHTAEELAALIEASPEYAAAPGGSEQATAPESVDDVEINRLAGLSVIQYERVRAAAADRLGLRASILDRLVAAARPDSDDGKQGRAIAFPEPEPWEHPIDGEALLDSIAGAIRGYVVMADHSRDAVALWVLHTFMIDRFMITPRLAVSSVVKRCGKTTLLDALGLLVYRPLSTASVTASAIFRTVEAYRPTLLVDEADTFLRNSDELRGVINSGHRRGGAVLRVVGDEHEPRAFSTFAACAIALIGQLPDTIYDRSVVVTLKRRLPGETVKPFRLDGTSELDVLARQAMRWSRDHGEEVSTVDPAMPDGVFNREADNWRALLAIADVAGKRWSERAREAAKKGHSDAEDESELVTLLTDIRTIFKGVMADSEGKKKIRSAKLVEVLLGVESSPWAELGKSRKPLSQNKLARMLKPLGIAPEVFWEEAKTERGYLLSQFADAFARYLPSEGDSNRKTVRNPINTGTSDHFQTVRPEPNITVAECEKSNNGGLSYGLTVAAPRIGWHEVERLAKDVEDWGSNRHDDGDLDVSMRAETRQRLISYGVVAECLDAEVERVLRAVSETQEARRWRAIT
jgi:hypothetical protein